MDPIISAHTALEQKGNLSKALTDVQKLIEQLQSARDAVAETPELTAMHMAKLKQPVKASFERIEEDLKEVNKGLNQYQKALNAKFKGTLPGVTEGPGGGGGPSGGEKEDVLDGEEKKGYVNRAITMHLLREGQFGVADAFAREERERRLRRKGAYRIDDEEYIQEEGDAMDEDTAPPTLHDPKMAADLFAGEGPVSNDLQNSFTEMYHILSSLRNDHDLEPAISWARANSQELENRGSNLEFELARLKFIELYISTHPHDSLTGPLLALDYARQTFPPFSKRYAKEIAALMGSLAFSEGLEESPYTGLFVPGNTNYTAVSATFTSEFCSLLGLSPTSPLYTAVTAGGISLPILSKLEKILTSSRGQWTSVNELPVETPLPPQMRFHSVFVCPVSKEQATDTNPPMMLPCGHVIAKESLEMHMRGKTRGKCPYCPVEFGRGEGRRVYI